MTLDTFIGFPLSLFGLVVGVPLWAARVEDGTRYYWFAAVNAHGCKL